MCKSKKNNFFKRLVSGLICIMLCDQVFSIPSNAMKDTADVSLEAYADEYESTSNVLESEMEKEIALDLDEESLTENTENEVLDEESSAEDFDELSDTDESEEVKEDSNIDLELVEILDEDSSEADAEEVIEEEMFASVKTMGASALSISLTDEQIYIQQGSGWCLRASKAMMLRRRAALDGNENWNTIEQESFPPANTSYVDSAKGLNMTFGKIATFARHNEGRDQWGEAVAGNIRYYMDQHPEGVVIYISPTDGSWNNHAVLLTSYDAAGNFYCLDPAKSYGPNQET